MIETSAKSEASGEAEGKTIAVPQTKIAPRCDPKHLKITSLWKCKELKNPGNILVVPQPGGAPRLLVIDSWNTVAEIGLDGKIAAKHNLGVEQEELVSNLRTAVGADGKRLYVAFGSAQQRLHLYDENWKLLINFPEDALKNRHQGIADVEFGDLDGDGSLLGRRGRAGSVARRKTAGREPHGEQRRPHGDRAGRARQAKPDLH
jgi:hypothetical protein